MIVELDLTLGAKLDAAFGRQSRPDLCPDCFFGQHNHVTKCGFCRCVEPLTVPASVADRLVLAGGQR